MELTPGYKQTQLGAFPSDWQELTVGDLQPFITSGSRGWARYYSTRGDLFVRITNMSRSSILLDLEKPQYVRLPPSGHEGSRTQLRPGDLLVSVTADIGIISWIDDGLETAAYINQHIALIRFLPTALHPRFGAYFLSHYPSQKRFRSITDQGAKAGINLQAVRDIPLVLPPTVDEQAAIAGALSDVDGLIGALDRIIAKKRDLKQAAMQQLLTGRTRLPGFASRTSLVESPVGKIPADWSVTRCDQLCSAIQDGTHFSPPIGGGERLYLTSRNIRFGVLDLNGAVYISEMAHRSIYSRCPVTKGDVLLTKDGANTGNAAIHCLDEEVSLLSSVAFLRFVAGKHDARFYLQYILSHSGQRRLSDLMSGNAITRLTLAKIRAWTMPSPPFEEQVAIADVLSEMDAEIAALESRRDKTRLLKQGMMQELLTGRTRLVDSLTTAGDR